MQVIAEGLVYEPNVPFIPAATPVMSGSFPPAVEDRFTLPLVIDLPSVKVCFAQMRNVDQRPPASVNARFNV